jgi:glycosyltransferase involved in cell wall biosynthesis
LWLSRAITQRIIARLTDSVVVQAPGLVDRAGKFNKGIRSKLTWIPNNVIAPSSGANFVAGNPDPAIRLLWVGGFALGKGADELLTLLRRGMELGIPLYATAVGTSSPLDRSIRPHIDHKHLRRRIEEEGIADRIEFLPRVNPTEMGSHYYGADWLFHVTQLDGSPRVVYEALIRGLPVIGSRHPGVSVLDPDDGHILFADPFDPDTVLDQLVAEKSDPGSHASRSESGREYVTEHFSSDAVSEKYVQLYSRLLSEHVD